MPPQVKAHEEQLKRHTERLQDELREVRAKESSVQPDAGHSGIQIDTPAEQAVQVLERLLAGSQVRRGAQNAGRLPAWRMHGVACARR